MPRIPKDKNQPAKVPAEPEPQDTKALEAQLAQGGAAATQAVAHVSEWGSVALACVPPNAVSATVASVLAMMTFLPRPTENRQTPTKNCSSE